MTTVGGVAPLDSYADLTTIYSLVNGQSYTFQNLGPGDILLTEQGQTETPDDSSIFHIVYNKCDCDTKVITQQSGMKLWAKGRGITNPNYSITESN